MVTTTIPVVEIDMNGSRRDVFVRNTEAKLYSDGEVVYFGYNNPFRNIFGPDDLDGFLTHRSSASAAEKAGPVPAFVDFGKGVTIDQMFLYRADYGSGEYGNYWVFQDTAADRQYIALHQINGSDVPELPTNQSELNSLPREYPDVERVPNVDFEGVTSVSVRSWINASSTDTDFLNFSRSDADQTFDLGEGDDTVYSGGGVDRIDGGRGDDRLVARSTGEGGLDVAYFNGDGGDDLLRAKNGTQAVFDGGYGDDRLYGSSQNDALSAGGFPEFGVTGSDHDLVFGLGGDDFLDGGQDDDFLYGGSGNDDVYGDDGDDALRGNRGADQLDGGDGNDDLRGGGGADSLHGGEGQDYLLGGGSLDILRGGLGDDTLIGGNGGGVGDGVRDTFVFDALDGFDRILDFEAGTDQIDLRGFGFDDFAADLAPLMVDRPSGVRIDLPEETTIFIVGLTSGDLGSGDFLL